MVWVRVKVSLGQISLSANPKTIPYFRGFFHRAEGNHYSMIVYASRNILISQRICSSDPRHGQVNSNWPVTEHYKDSTKLALRYFHQATNSRSCFANKLENGGRRVAPSSPRIMPMSRALFLSPPMTLCSRAL